MTSEQANIETRNVLPKNPINFLTAFLDNPFLQGPIEVGIIAENGTVTTRSGTYTAQCPKGELPQSGARVIVYRI